MLRFENVTFSYPQDSQPTLSGLSFEVPKGGFVSLIGASGCGKSTIFRIVCGLLKAQSGSITVGGRPIGEQKQYCGYMPQRDLLFPWRSVEENVCLPMELQGGIPKDRMRGLAREALRTAGLEGWEDKSPAELSGGMRQRAAFARTLMTGSDLLLLDEPFSALDYLTRISMREWLLQQWEQDKKTIFFITHDVEEAIFLSSEILVADTWPITQLKRVTVPLGWPRTQKDLARPDIQELKAELIEHLRRKPDEE